MPLSTDAILSVDETKLFLGIESSAEGTAHDSVVQLVEMVSDAVIKFIGYKLISQEHTEFYNGNGRDRLYMRHKPITATPTVSIDTTQDQTWQEVVATWSWSVLYEQESGEIRLAQGNIFPDGHKNIKVVYTAGYARASIPFAIKLAALNLVSWYRVRADHMGIKSENTGANMSTTYDLTEWPADVTAALIPFRRQTIGY